MTWGSLLHSPVTGETPEQPTVPNWAKHNTESSAVVVVVVVVLHEMFSYCRETVLQGAL